MKNLLVTALAALDKMEACTDAMLDPNGKTVTVNLRGEQLQATLSQLLNQSK